MIDFLQSGVQIPASNVFAWQNDGPTEINIEGRNAMKNRIQYLKDKGFDHVRCGWRMNKKTVYQDSSNLSNHIGWYKECIDEALRVGLRVVLNPNHYWKQNDDDCYISSDDLVQLWETLDDAFKDYSTDKVVYELMNEPRYNKAPYNNPQVDPNFRTWEKIMNNVHTRNPNRYIIFCGFNFPTWSLRLTGGYRQVNAALAFDYFTTESGISNSVNRDRLIASIHCYEPKAFTNWSVSGSQLTITEQEVNEKFEMVKNSVMKGIEEGQTSPNGGNETYNYPVYVGELGCNWTLDITNATDAANRKESIITWIKTMTTHFRNEGWGCCLWTGFALGAFSSHQESFAITKPSNNWYNNDIDFDPVVNGLDQQYLNAYLTSPGNGNSTSPGNGDSTSPGNGNDVSLPAFTITLKQGWNLIGTKEICTISPNTNIENTLWFYENGSYQSVNATTDELPALKGFWIKATSQTVITLTPSSI